MTADSRNSSPYVGPRPFSAADREVFFGRDGEIAQLVSLVIAHRHVLLYSVSGAGKTSLLRAGLVPALREEGFEVLPPLRLQAPVPPAGVRSAFTYAALSRLVNDPEAPRPADGRELDPGDTLGGFLDALERGRDRYGFPSPRLLVLDQFEELFTLYPDRWPQREEFLREIADACERDAELRVVFSLREEYVAQLERYARVLPDGLRARFHLDRLRKQPALVAVTGPLARRDVNFAPGVAEKLIHNLQETRVDLGEGEAVAVEGEFVEPVHLQVVCRSLWERLAPGAHEVTADDLAALGSVDASLIRYYDEAVAAAVARARVGEHALRAALERSFITSAGTRATVFAGADETAHLPATALDEFAARHLIRAEWRAGGRWLELAHDRLIGPVRRSNARVRERRRRRRLRRIGAATALLVAAAVGGLVLTVWDLSEELERPRPRPQLRPATAKVATPNVIGAPSERSARRRLVKLGVELGHVGQRVDLDAAPGSIVDQTPRAPELVVKGTEVDVIKALGERRVRVPDLRGATLERAESVLQRSRLTLSAATSLSAGEATRVVRQKPAAGKKVVEGTSIDVLVREPSPAAAARPDLAVETLGIDVINNSLIVTVAVRNLAGATAPPTSLVATARGLPPVRVRIGSLPVGQERRLEIRMLVPRAMRGEPVVVVVAVDPQDAIRERNEDNNADFTAPLPIPPAVG